MAQCVRCPKTVPDDVLYCEVCREIEIAENQAKWKAREDARGSEPVARQNVVEPLIPVDVWDEDEPIGAERVPEIAPVTFTSTSPASTSNDDSFVQSLLIGGLSNNSLYGTLLGGNAMGAIVGDLMADGKLGQEKNSGK
ncbi:MAG: hypothetical protein KF777_06560 [Planctomycetaceae bacterium]|nr:hypothetical protein [Planctomycetaceae bacterium]